MQLKITHLGFKINYSKINYSKINYIKRYGFNLRIK